MVEELMMTWPTVTCMCADDLTADRSRSAEQMLQNMHGEKKLMKMQTSSFIAYTLSKI